MTRHRVALQALLAALACLAGVLAGTQVADAEVAAGPVAEGAGTVSATLS